MKLLSLIALLFSCNCVTTKEFLQVTSELQAQNIALAREVLSVRKDVNDLVRYKDAIVSGDIKIEGIVTK